METWSSQPEHKYFIMKNKILIKGPYSANNANWIIINR